MGDKEIRMLMKKSCLSPKNGRLANISCWQIHFPPPPHKCKVHGQMANDWPVSLETLVPHSGSAMKHVTESCVIQLPYRESEEVGV